MRKHINWKNIERHVVTNHNYDVSRIQFVIIYIEIGRIFGIQGLAEDFFHNYL